MRPPFLSRFTPSLMSPEVLEGIFVQRERLARRTVSLVRESVLGATKHHTLLVGPRGIGKTHFVSLVHHRVQAMDDLRERMRIAWLREEEWGVSSFLDLLLRILRALDETYPGEDIDRRTSALYDLRPDRAEQEAIRLVDEILSGRTLFLIVENLDDLFRGLQEEGQQRLRAYLQNHNTWTILAASQGLFSGVSLQTSPFYGFFRIKHLKELEFEDAVELLKKIASLGGQDDLAAFLATPTGRARVRAVHHLAGGNPRIYVILSQFLTREALDELVDAFLGAMDGLTPYYQSRMAWLSPQQRKIVDLMCTRGSALPVKEIAQRAFMTHQTASSQLKALREYGYVRSTTVGRESFYELREPLMRLSFEVKKQRGAPIRLFIDFLRFWYSRHEIVTRLSDPELVDALEQDYLRRALEMVRDDVEDPRVSACIKDCDTAFLRASYTDALSAAEELVALRGAASDYARHVVCLGLLRRFAEAEEVLLQALQRYAESADLNALRAGVLNSLERGEEAVSASDVAIRLDPNAAGGWLARVAPLMSLGRLDEALRAMDRAAELGADNPILRRVIVFALVSAERFDEALAAADRVLETNPGDVEVWIARAGALTGLDRVAEAITALDRARDLEPENPDVWRSRGRLLQRMGRHEAAVEAFDRLRALTDGRDLVAWIGMARSFESLRRYPEALAAISEAIAREPADRRPQFALVRICALMGEWDQALEQYADLVRLKGLSSDQGALFVLVWSLLVSGPEEAWSDRSRRLLDVLYGPEMRVALGICVLVSITVLRGDKVEPAAFRRWLANWRLVGTDVPAIQLAVGWAEAALEYRLTGDPRVLLNIPLEQRQLLEAALNPIGPRTFEFSRDLIRGMMGDSAADEGCLFVDLHSI